ncbi:LysR substrate-binding domain-containing protein [Ignavigranum ruoffiae]|uniref:LysR substrate-binding domain-containing protein n=1 Tax=Ignavigranum ruoffiae TaxID=89093 RepID=UPI003B00AA6A
MFISLVQLFGVTLDIQINNTNFLLHQLKKNALDFVVLEGSFDKEKYAYRRLSNEIFTGICSNGHFFANKKVDIDDLLNERLFIREIGSGSRNILENLLGIKGQSIDRFKDCVSISNIHLIKKLIEKDLGVTFAYRKILTDYDNLTTFEVLGLTTFHEFNIVSMKNTHGLEQALNFFNEL